MRLAAIRTAPDEAAPFGWPEDARARSGASGRPPFRTDLVPRPRLLRPLLGPSPAPLAVMIAPAGYGKTTLLSEWAERDKRPFAWVSLDEGHNDPARLIAAVANALREVEARPPDLLAAFALPQLGVSTALSRLGRYLAGVRRPFVLVLDDLHRVQDDAALEALAIIIDYVAPGSILALSSRAEPRLRLGRLRANRRVFELRAADLAMTRLEAGMLLKKAGLDLKPAEVDSLLRRTEGWPAGLYLAALSLHHQPDHERALRRFGGDDRLVADYLRDELLSTLPDGRIAFLTRTSVLDRLCGPLCDAVLEQRHSGQVLMDLSRSNVLLAPLDRSDEHYRYHGLFAEMLRAELRRGEPEREAQLHRRASAWHEQHGDVDHAVGHAIAAGDLDHAGELIWAIVPTYAFSGRVSIVQHWLGALGDDQIAASPPLALSAAATHLVDGDRDAVDNWASAAGRDLARARGEMRSSLVAGLAVMRAAVARNGLHQLAVDAAQAHDLTPNGGPWRSLCRMLLGVANHLTGDADGARVILGDIGRHGAPGAPSIQALTFSQLALLAAERDDWVDATDLSERARRQCEDAGARDEASSALVYAVSASVRAHGGRVEDARQDLRHGTRLLALLANAAPWYEAESRIALARAALHLSDVIGARTLLREASAFLHREPEAVVLRKWLDDGWERADAFSSVALAGPSALTTAELRILRFLPSHLSFREIAERLYVSINTVKSQALAVYRKLDVSSRSEAVTRAHEIGLLDR